MKYIMEKLFAAFATIAIGAQICALISTLTNIPDVVLLIILLILSLFVFLISFPE